MTRVRLCAVDELAPGEMRRVERSDADPLAVYNIDGTFHATADTCTHAHASLSEGDLEGSEVVCPVHGGAFDVPSGKALCFPVKEDLDTFPVTVEGEQVFAEVVG